MQAPLLMMGLCLAAVVSGCGPKAARSETVKLDGPTMVEAACGQCQLGLTGKKGCDLTIRHEGASYFVDGFKMTDLGGDAHAADGLCTVVRKAKVVSQIQKLVGRLAPPPGISQLVSATTSR